MRKYYKRQSVITRVFRRTLAGEKMNVGAYMWAAQRVTGLIILLFFVLHLYTLSAILDSPGNFDQTMALMDHPLIKLLEVILLGTVFFHAFNGVRLILINFFVDINQKVLAYGVSVANIIFIIISLRFIY